jgi:hypothetical protein
VNPIVQCTLVRMRMRDACVKIGQIVKDDEFGQRKFRTAQVVDSKVWTEVLYID